MEEADREPSPDGPDPFGRALRDHQRGEREAPLYQCEGAETREHPIQSFYFDPRDPDGEWTRWRESWLEGPLLDAGAGAGRDALYFQERMATVALEVSDHLVATMRARGVEDARWGDMFDLRATFGPDRFRSVQAVGTQATLAPSGTALQRLLADLAYVTDDGGTVLLDGYDPAAVDPEMLGYRPDPAPGLARRVFYFEYEDERGPTLLFRLFSPDRLRAAAAGTAWSVAEVRYASDHRFNAALQKR
jgi:SAM-dependent methyltransferase